MRYTCETNKLKLYWQRGFLLQTHVEPYTGIVGCEPVIHQPEQCVVYDNLQHERRVWSVSSFKLGAGGYIARIGAR